MHGIETALARVLVDPRFVFRFETRTGQRRGAALIASAIWSSRRAFRFSCGAASRTTNSGSATRVSCTSRRCWSGRRGACWRIPRSETLVTNFAGQWLYLRELKNRAAARREIRRQPARSPSSAKPSCSSTASCGRTAASSDLLNADYTFVDERWRRTTEFPNVHGSQFRRVAIQDDARRGLLGQGSFLLVTSVANRTSPVARGKWILENILGRRRLCRRRTCRRSRRTTARCRPRRCASGWRSIARIPPARPATRSWTRSDSRWRISI